MRATASALALALVAVATTLVACTNRSPLDPPEPPARPPAHMLGVGRLREYPLPAGGSVRFRIDLAAGSSAIGAVDQHGVDVVVVVTDPKGVQLGSFDGPNGDTGPEPFSIDADAAGAYDVEVRAFVASAATAPAAPPGRFTIHVDETVTADVAEKRRVADRMISPTLSEVWLQARAHDEAAVDAWWSSLAGHAPLVEPSPGHPDESIVSFVMRSTGPYVALTGGPDWFEKPLVRIPNTDLWYLSVRMPKDARFLYGFVEADRAPDFQLPFHKAPWNNPRDARAKPDPNNPHDESGMSRAELPAAPAQPWIAARADVAKGKLTELTLASAMMQEPRRVAIYTPASYDPARTYPLVIAFDGETYGMAGDPTLPLPTILDNLIAAGKIPPVVAALVANQGTRDRDLPGSEPFAHFVVDELLPEVRTNFHAGLTAATTLVTGSSYGGLCSAFIALRHSDSIGNVLSQSGAFQFERGHGAVDTPITAEGNWLARDYARSPAHPVRFYLEAGRFEPPILEANRHLRDVLQAKGYSVHYTEFSGGHDYAIWRGTIADGLMTLLAAPDATH